MPRITNIQPRRGTASLWTSNNPVLADGEIGIETDTGKVKFGNGSAGWTALPYAIPGGYGLQTLDSPGAWDGWKKALANIQTTPVRILSVGDSITEGTGVTARSDTWVNKLAQKIRNAYPAVPQTNPWGWIPFVQASTTLTSPFTIAGSYTTTSRYGFRTDQCVGLNAGATITFTVTATSIDIWHAKGTATGTFTVKKNGVQIGGSYGGTNPTSQSGFKQSVSLGASASYTIVITNNSANTVYLNGVTAWDGNENSGVNIVNAGRHGWTSQSWEDGIAINNGEWGSDIRTYDPHLVTIMLGANDYTSLVGRTELKSNLTSIINKIRDSQDYYSSIVLVSSYKRSEVVFPKWEHYEFAMRDLATELGCGYIDLRQVMPDVGTTEANNAGLYVDTVHPSIAGMTRVSDELAKVLLNPLLGQVPAAPYLEPILHVHAVATQSDAGFMSISDKTKLDSAASGLTPSVIVMRDANSNFSSGDPLLSAHVANKAYVDSMSVNGGLGGAVLGTNGKTYRVIACVVRNTGSGFDFISDASHSPVGVSSISTAGDDLSFTINYSFTAGKVSSLVATPDETLSQKGYVMGASVGLSSATFSVGQPGGWGDYISYNGSAWTSFNGYVSSTTINGTSGLITCTHDDMSSPVAGQVNSRSFTYRAAAASMGNTTSGLYLVNNSGVTLKTANSTDCQFFLQRSGSRKVKMTELNIANANIWIFGMLEV